MIEIFAGSAILCSTAKQMGLIQSFGVDKFKTKKARANVIQIDLLDDEQFELLLQWIADPLVCWIHLAPVCGTASKAREIPAGPFAPRPLRSSDFPEGFETLSGIDALRVEAANALYSRACEIFRRGSELGKILTLENPSNSYFWITKWWLRVQAELDVFASDFHGLYVWWSPPKMDEVSCQF